jgi:electron transfer flavoprotein beta subunit
MKISVAVKQVPARDSELRISNSGIWIDETGLAFEINEQDAYALEEALHLKERCGGEVIAVTVGPARAAQALREALAKGADRAIHVELDGVPALDALATARLLAAAIAPESPDLVLAGLQSEDTGQGQTGVMLARELGLPHATIVVDVEPLDGRIRVRRELEEGWSQTVEIPLPALLTIQSGIRPLRYASLMGIKKARTKELRTLRAADLAGGGGAALANERIFIPERGRRTHLFDGPPGEAVERLLEKLRIEARVL